MGWLFYAPTRSALIHDLIRPEGQDGRTYETLRWCTRGNNLWAVHQRTAPDAEPIRFVALYLMANSKHGWGYKDMDEGCGPYQYNVPLSYLDDLTEPVNDYSREWRAKVREYHTGQASRREWLKTLAVGDAVQIGRHAYTVARLPEKGEWWVRRCDTGGLFSARSSQLDRPQEG